MDRRGSSFASSFVAVPALVVSAILLVFFYKNFGINLLFPLHFFASKVQLIAIAFIPALVLTFSCGLLFGLVQSIKFEYAYWLSKPFAIVMLATGQNINFKLRRLILLKSLSQTWNQCLPWLFGELIVVESVFNAPGLGLDAWHLAKVRDFVALLEVIFWLVLLYIFCRLIAHTISSRVGLKLTGYL
ncbi:MAG: hypothetical protein R3B45_00640 [Bdellovibrionota bacterium]